MRLLLTRTLRKHLTLHLKAAKVGCTRYKQLHALLTRWHNLCRRNSASYCAIDYYTRVK